MNNEEKTAVVDNQITLTGFEAPEHHEKEFLFTIESDLRAAIEAMGGDSCLMSISTTKPTNFSSGGYTVVKFGNLTAFRLKIRGKQHHISIPLTMADLIPDDVPRKKTSGDGKYCRILITDKHPLDSYKNFLVNVVSETVNRYPKEWDCCSRYLECSDAKTCIHPDKAFALGCGYRKILNSGRIFYGKNRNI